MVEYRKNFRFFVDSSFVFKILNFVLLKDEDILSQSS